MSAVSIVIPPYNKSSYIVHALNSVLAKGSPQLKNSGYSATEECQINRISITKED
ncbi:hypothetical protein DSECCO2_93560 [anaerobic digester metagenome]